MSRLTAIQAISFSFLMGFLPPRAYHRYAKAKEYGLINDLGRPDVSSFATFAYAAGVHIDQDVCMSHGWVCSRSPQVFLNSIHDNISPF
jgi:hypothetical protein